MYRKTYYATHPGSVEGATNEELRDCYHIPGLFAEGELWLNYLHYERLVIGGAASSGGPLSLPAQREPASASGRPFLERRAMTCSAPGLAQTFINGEPSRLFQTEGDGGRIGGASRRRPSGHQPDNALTLSRPYRYCYWLLRIGSWPWPP